MTHDDTHRESGRPTVDDELRTLSPELARLRGANDPGPAPTDEHLARLAAGALARAEAVPGSFAERPSRVTTPRAARRSRRLPARRLRALAWASAAAIALFVAAMLWLPGEPSTVAGPPRADEAGTAAGEPLADDPLTELLLADAALEDLDYSATAAGDDLFGPTELALLDWADDGVLEDELSAEALWGAVGRQD